LKRSELLVALLLLVAPNAVTAGEDAAPGTIILGQDRIIGSGLRLCACQDYFYVEARVPEQDAVGVRFELSWDPSIGQPASAELWGPDFVDVSSSGDNVWDIQFNRCIDANSYVRLLFVYPLSTIHLNGVCTAGREVPFPMWSLCSGDSLAGPLYQWSEDWPYFDKEGCFSNIYWGPIEDEYMTWSVLRSRY